MSCNLELEEPLRLASADEVNQLISIYERHLPSTVQFVLLLENIKRMQAIICDSELENASHRFRKSIYVLKDRDIKQHATFVAIGPDKDIFIIPHTLQNPPIELTEAIRVTKYIKWKLHPVFVIEANNEIQEHLSQAAESRNLKLQVWSDCLNYWMPKQKASKVTYSVPQDVTLRPLQEEHAQFLNDTWPYRYEQSKWYIETAIRVNGGFGLFDTKDESLVACVFKNDHDSVGHLYTIPSRTQRGYGSTLAKAITKKIAFQDNQHALAFISPSNEQSIRIFTKIGYLPVSRTLWLSSKPATKNQLS
ncbi:uncharacterized protein LOC126570745 [Anopheles aquasalis]|uniref:uncharacterized protein LOC126570745 n=1 Tax=Anopheles aquasalis TaxID=42839 RepID=UPI00215ABEBC|nr:uncharacterized protein LOC126570745 [Anopheles aquasalis]